MRFVSGGEFVFNKGLLGFAEPPSERVQPKFFPSKIGGKPAWLVPLDLPPSCELSCSHCEHSGRSHPLSFILQLYAPRGDLVNRLDAFHRTIFVFACSSCGGNWVVYRSQLARVNDFYPPEPPAPATGGDASWSIQSHDRCCIACGIPIDGDTSGERSSHICCGGTTADKIFPEHLIEIESEGSDDGSDDGSSDEEVNEESREEDVSEFLRNAEESQSAEARLLKDYLQKLQNPDSLLDKSEEAAFVDISKSFQDRNRCASKLTTDPAFQLFMKKWRSRPEHVIRYASPSSDHPLWFLTPENPVDPPPCEHCGAPRSFEFQVQPHVINILQRETGAGKCKIDFGVVAVYTCSQSCRPQGEREPAYQKEWCFVQLDPDSAAMNCISVEKPSNTSESH
eukprot:GHVN01072594.1.p1 GENE.GHVN01072594.1~~GHVN01072594.1.p1  ORF type:complete len:412 (+),score=25.73 GHVN01072594.1:50-1237(+)